MLVVGDDGVKRHVAYRTDQREGVVGYIVSGHISSVGGTFVPRIRVDNVLLSGRDVGEDAGTPMAHTGLNYTW